MPRIDPSRFLDAVTEAFDFRISNPQLDTRFRELAEWDSMVSISIVAMAYCEYDVHLTGDELVSCGTLSDLLDTIQGKKPETV